MTTATTEGRRLVLTVEGIDAPFAVDPLPAKRGKALTEQFILSALKAIPLEQSEQIFIECIGAQNYSRMSGMYVDEFHPNGMYVTTWSPDGATPNMDLPRDFPQTLRYIAREALEGEADIEGEAIRQEEAESLCLCAFYWQTVVGMEAVTAFLEGGEGTVGSLKALSLLQIRLGFSPQMNSSSPVMESLTRQDDSEGTSATPSSFGSVPLPANKVGHLPATNKRRFARRR